MASKSEILSGKVIENGQNSAITTAVLVLNQEINQIPIVLATETNMDIYRLPRDLRLPLELYDENGQIIRLNLPFNVVLITPDVPPLQEYQFVVPKALESFGVTLSEWKACIKPLISISQLRNTNRSNRLERWNVALSDWQLSVNRYFNPKGMHLKVISHKEGICDANRNLHGGKYWISIALTPEECSILGHEPSMTGPYAQDYSELGYMVHPDFGQEITPMQSRGCLWSMFTRHKLAKFSEKRRLSGKPPDNID